MRIGIVAGEASGDLLGAGLINAVRKRNPAVEFEGVAGPMMQAAGCKVIENADALAVMGLIEPIREVPRLLRLRRMLVSRWQADPPDVVIGIDAPDFNLGLELKLRRSGIRTVQYVSPTVWAWRQGRIKKIRKAVDLVLCLLPFEKQFYDEHDVAAVFVGHPVACSTRKLPLPLPISSSSGAGSVDVCDADSNQACRSSGPWSNGGISSWSRPISPTSSFFPCDESEWPMRRRCPKA